MNHLIYLQNKLSLRFSKLGYFDIFSGVFLFFLAEYLLIYKQLFVVSNLIVVISLYAIQDSYKRRLNAIDVLNLINFPISLNKKITNYIYLDFFEYKSFLIIIHLLIVFFYYNIWMMIVSLFLFISFSFYLAIHNFLVKRNALMQQILLRFWAVFAVIVGLSVLKIVVKSKNSNDYLSFFQDIDNIILQHIYISFITSGVVCVILYFATLVTIKKYLTTRPFIIREEDKKENG